MGLLARTSWKRFGIYREHGTAVAPMTEDGRAYWEPPQRWVPPVVRWWSPPKAYWNFGLADWMPAAALAALPIARGRQLLAARRATRRTRTGRCTGCGYDLRATPDRCPECGTTATALI